MLHPHLAAFVANHCHRCPAAIYEAKQLCADFYYTLPTTKARGSWRRSRVLTDLAQAGFSIGLLHGVTVVGGLAPRAEFRAVDGRLELARA